MEKVTEMADDTSNMSQGDTLRLLNWIQSFERFILKIGGKRITGEVKEVVMTLAEIYNVKSQDTLSLPIQKVSSSFEISIGPRKFSP